MPTTHITTGQQNGVERQRRAWLDNIRHSYNQNFSCPIPPKENRLGVAIRAGEKVFHAEGDEH